MPVQSSEKFIHDFQEAGTSNNFEETEVRSCAIGALSIGAFRIPRC